MSIFLPAWVNASRRRCDRASSMQALFGIEIEACVRCGGQLRIIASIEEREVIAKIRAHLERVVPQQYSAEWPPGARAPPSRACLL